MKNLFNLVVTCIVAANLMGCASAYEFMIETREPAKVTFPVEVENVVIVNNSVPQPSNIGYECFVNESETRTGFELNYDSAQTMLASSLAHAIRKEVFFGAVFLNRKPVRELSKLSSIETFSDTIAEEPSSNEEIEKMEMNSPDTNRMHQQISSRKAEIPATTPGSWLEAKIIPDTLAGMIYGLSGAQSMISIDKCLFTMSQKAYRRKDPDKIKDRMYYYMDIRTDIMMTASIYVEGNEIPIHAFTYSDSLFYKSEVYGDSVALFRNLPNYLLKEIAYESGRKMIPLLVPAWKEDYRMVYGGSSSRMSEALTYAKKDKWAEAEAIWKSLLEKENKLLNKATLAYNLAVANEMQDDFEEAERWAGDAVVYVKQLSPDRYKNEVERITSYQSKIKKRKIDNVSLNKQLGVEE